METCVRYLSHPQVEIDPNIPVPMWTLNAVGRQRVHALAEVGWLSGTTEVIASGEVKAIETAEILAAALGLSVEIREAMHENDRSATGYLPRPEFEDMVRNFFAAPAASIRGWEPALAAQARIVREMEAVLDRTGRGDVLVVGHGAVGTLLFCHYAKVAIDRAHDQPDGGGNYFTFLRHDRRVLHPWRAMEVAPSDLASRPAKRPGR